MASLRSKRKTVSTRQSQLRVAGAKTPAKSAAVVNLVVAAPAAFDQALYNTTRERFGAAVASCSDERDIEQVMRVLIKQELDAGGKDAALRMRPYIVQYMCEHRARVAQRD